MWSAASATSEVPVRIETVALDRVDVDLLGRKEAGAVHRLLADEHRRDDRDESLSQQPRRARTGRAPARRARRRPSGRRNASPRSAPRAPCRSTRARGGRAARTRSDGGSPTRRSSTASSSVQPSGAVGSGGFGTIESSSSRRAAADASCLLEPPELFLHRPQLLDLLGRRLALQLRPAAQVVDLRDEVEPGTVGGHQLVERVAGPLAIERGAPGIGVAAGGADVDHERESRTASMTCATPSSSAGGQTRSARARRRS